MSAAPGAASAGAAGAAPGSARSTAAGKSRAAKTAAANTKASRTRTATPAPTKAAVARTSAAGGRTQVRLAGFGGQGIVLGGMILGKAITLFGGANAVMTQSYGPEARGGACSADVVVSQSRINYPRVTTPDVLVLMSEEAARTYGPNTAEGALVLVNENLVRSVPAAKGLRVLKVPATGIAEGLGRVIVANIVMLGFITAVAGVVSFEAMKSAVLDSIPAGTEELNLRALRAGYEHGKGMISE